MRIRTYVVPPDLMPLDLDVAAWPTPDGVAVFLTELVPPSMRGPYIDAIAGAFLRQRAAMTGMAA